MGKLQDEIGKLSSEEKVELAIELLALEDSGIESKEYDERLLALLDERRAAYLANPNSAIPAEDALADIRAKIR